MMSPLRIPSDVNPAASPRVRSRSCAYVTGAGVTIASRSGASCAQRSSQSVSVGSTASSLGGKRNLRSGKAAKQVEHALAPGGERIASFKHFELTDDPRPLEQAEQDVVRIRRIGARQK